MKALLFLAVCSAACAAEPTIPYGHNPSAGHFAQVNGIRLHYETYGKGRPLVMMHGNGGDISAMRFQIDHFKETHWVIAVDSRGHGQSEMGSGDLTYDRMADDVCALLEQLKAEPADLLGWSDGGIVALAAVIRHPERVHSIALSGANLTPESLGAKEVESMRHELAHARAMLASGDKTQPWAAICQYQLLMINNPHITDAQLAAIHVPALVMAGEHDLIPDPHTRHIAASIPGARLYIFRGAGHGALLEVPDAFNQVLAGFLDSQRN